MPASIDFLHIPKTAGTSVSGALRTTMVGYRYFGTRTEFLEHNNIDDYSCVAGHFYYCDIEPFKEARHNTVISVIRNPVDRFLSAIQHARRKSEKPETFGPNMRAMRSLSIHEYLQTGWSNLEINALSTYLGTCARRSLDVHSTIKLTLQRAREGAFILFSQSELGVLERFLSIRLGRAINLPKLNCSAEEDTLSKSERVLVASDEFQSRFVDQVRLYEALRALTWTA